jgi:hypothetical protein
MLYYHSERTEEKTMERKKDKLYEVDLFKPVQKHFTKMGYSVFGEVNDCDVVAIKEEELIVVELKLNLNVDLLIQATNRQRLADQVYIAIPKPKYKRNSKKWHDMSHLIKRLELGLIVVTFLKSGAKLDVIFPPGPYNRQSSIQSYKRKRKKLLEEIAGRKINKNLGGSSQTKIMTAYKETCIHIAYCLQKYGPLSPKVLRQMGTGDKTLSILSKNYYGWFRRVERGVYGLTEVGKKEIKDFPQAVKYYAKLTDEKSD